MQSLTNLAIINCSRVFHVAQIQASPANNKINLSNFNSDKKTQSAALFWRMYKCRHEFHWNAVKVTVFPQTLTLSSQTSRQKKNAGVRVMGDRRFRVAQTSFSDHPFSTETLLCEKVAFFYILLCFLPHCCANIGREV